MNRISNPLEDIQEHYDVVVIGSGYGGGIAASRLSRAGQRVCLLERGKEFMPGEFPDTLVEATENFQADTPERKIGSELGLYNFHIGKDVNVLVGCGLGGTSLINANVSLKLDPRVWTNGKWPSAILKDKIGIDAGYDRAEEMLKPNAYPGPEVYPVLKKYEAHKKSGEFLKTKVGLDNNFYKTPINVTFEDKINHVGVKQNACTNCGDCVSGCNVTAKNTTQMNYLPDAWNHGCEIFTQCNVDWIEKKNAKWLIHFSPLGEGRNKFNAPDMFVSADNVVVSAGTVGSTEIMLRSKAKGLAVSDMVGKRFSGNGDVLGMGYNCDQEINGFGYGKEKVNPKRPVGPCITSVIDTRENSENYRKGLIIEEGSCPGPVRAPLPEVFAAMADTEGIDTDAGFVDKVKEKLRVFKSYIGGAHKGAMGNTQIYLIMSHDDADGEIELNDKDRLHLNWPGYGKEGIFEYANDTLRDCTKPLGGTYLKNPIWSKVFNQDLISVHPLGGCIMAEDAQTGVVNHKGQVFDFSGEGAVHEGLYITDGSVVPCSLGVNPLLTISAISERNIALMAEERFSKKIDYTLPSAPKHNTVYKPGIRFTETMKGYFSKSVTGEDAYQKGYDTGKLDDSKFEFTLTIASEDLEAMINEPEHLARMAGTVIAPDLSSAPLTVTEGVFNLFVDYKEEVNTRRMKYATKMITEEGRSYYFKGFKEVNDNHGSRVWHDTSTLYITIFDGADDTCPEIGKGILHIEPADFLKQMTTMKVIHESSAVKRLEYMSDFGKSFAGSLWDIYGGIFHKVNYWNPSAPPRQKRLLRAPAPELHTFATADGLNLRLTRYKPEKVTKTWPVICVHGLGVSSEIFSTDTIGTNMVEYLVADGFDVWLLDYRHSIALTYMDEEYSGDEVARYDHPAAVAKVLEVTSKTKVQMVVHCWGSSTFLMSMLGNYVPANSIQSVVVSQAPTHVVMGKVKTMEAGVHLPGVFDLLGIEGMTSKSSTDTDFWGKLYDKALELMPLEKKERCHNSVCHRITFIYGLLYEHDQLNETLHDNLHELFGMANIQALKHLTTIVRKGHLVNSKGEDVYLPHIKRLALPILLISGEENKCYYPESTKLSFEALCAANGSELYEREVIPNYGHIDCMFGKNADEDVFGSITTYLNTNQVEREPNFPIKMTVRHPELSLWKSAVEEGLLKSRASGTKLRDVHTHPLMQSSIDYVHKKFNGLEMEKPEVAESQAYDSHKARRHASSLFHDLAKAKVSGDKNTERQIQEEIEKREYSNSDPMFATIVPIYESYFLGGLLNPIYYDWKSSKYGKGNIDYGVIDYVLPPGATVGIMGDWATGMEDAEALLADLVKRNPTVIIHLGDIYYAGTDKQADKNFLEIFDRVYNDLRPSKPRIPIFNLAGNHDYYARGTGFYRTLSRMNEGLDSKFNQEASYFCLRNHDKSWQFLGLDTGVNDHKFIDAINPFWKGPNLNDSEVEWHQDKLSGDSKNAKRTILLSHHQLFSRGGVGAFDAGNDYLNEHLYSAFRDDAKGYNYFPKIAAWIWGHEHDFAIYEDNLFDLEKGRLLGCSAYEAPKDDKKLKFAKQVPKKDFKLDVLNGYLNHGYAVIQMPAANAVNKDLEISYYQYPSWGIPENSNPPILKSKPLITKEVFKY